MLATRVATAAVLLAGFIGALLLLPMQGFAAVVGVLVLVAGFEWGRLCGLASTPAALYAAVLTALYGALGTMLSVRPGLVFVVWIIAALFWALGAPLSLRQGLGRTGPALLWVAGALVLVPAALAMLALAPPLLLAVLGLVWVADTAAYFAGRAFGRRKLAPETSPGKTWEGVAGALLASLAWAIICTALLPELGERVRGAAWAALLAGALVLCAAGVLGDLLESALKRRAAVKDSGTLLPGHGGLLDRIDSATASLPIAVLLWQWSADR